MLCLQKGDKTKMIRLFSMFSGFAGSEFALKKAGIEFEVVGFSEIDKYAIQCYQQNHCVPFIQGMISTEHILLPKNFGDCTKINTDELPDFDLLTGGFPCQDVSLAGKRDLSKGRTNLYSEILRIAKAKKPKYLLLENVEGLLSMGKSDKASENAPLVNLIVRDLKAIGYGVIYDVLNSKDYGIPQSRSRVWFVCKLGGWDFLEFQFPEKQPLKIFVKDILEKDVDEKYFLSPLLQERFKTYLAEKHRVVNLQPREGKGLGGKGIISKADGTTYCLDSANTQAIVAMRQRDRDGKEEEKGQQFEPRGDGCSNTLTSVEKDNLVYDRKGFDSRTKGFRESELCPTLSVKMGTGGNNVPMVKDIANCLKIGGRVSKPEHYYEKGHDNFAVSKNLLLRRLTPRECFRLMGFLNDEINLEGISDSRLYKLAGNGWEINVVSKIFKQMFKVSKGNRPPPTFASLGKN